MKGKIIFAFLDILVFLALLFIPSGDFTRTEGWIQYIVSEPPFYDNPVFIPERPGVARRAVQAARYRKPETLGQVCCLWVLGRIHHTVLHYAA